MATSKRRGSLILVVMVLALVIGLAVFSFDFMTKTDVTTTVNLVRELQATNLAESIAAQIEARANRHPWELRFWLKESLGGGTTTPGAGLEPQITFNKGSGHVRLDRDVLPADSYDFVGVVKDVDPGRREYRIYVEVLLQGESYTFSWDKRYLESLLGGMNADTSRLDKRLEQTPPNARPTDQLIDKIKASAAAPPPDALDTRFAELLKQLQQDKTIFEGSNSVPPEPTGTPSPPPPPLRGLGP